MRLTVLALLATALSCSRAPEPPPKASAPPTGPAKILNFYAATPTIHKGEDGLLCYGVEKAEWVKLDPPVEKLWPALSRCFNVKPDATTTYTISVPGHAQTARISVDPSPAMKAAKLIRIFVVDRHETKPGPVTVCIGVQNAKSVKLDPGGRAMPPLERACIAEPVRVTTTFRLTVTGNDGTVETKEQTVKVVP